MRYASTWKDAAGVETYSRTVCPSAAYTLSANPSIALDACAGMRHAEVPGRAFSCSTQLARMPLTPSNVAGVTRAGGGVLGALGPVGAVCVVETALWWCVAVQPDRMTAIALSATNVLIQSPTLTATARATLRWSRIAPTYDVCSRRQKGASWPAVLGARSSAK